MANIVLLDKDCMDVLSPQTAFYGDVDCCVRDVRRRHPQAFPWDRWIHDSRFYGLLTDEQRAIMGCDLEWLLVWGGPFQSGVAILVRKHSGGGWRP